MILNEVEVGGWRWRWVEVEVGGWRWRWVGGRVGRVVPRICLPDS